MIGQSREKLSFLRVGRQIADESTFGRIYAELFQLSLHVLHCGYSAPGGEGYSEDAEANRADCRIFLASSNRKTEATSTSLVPGADTVAGQSAVPCELVSHAARFELADLAPTASNRSEQRSLSSMENERAKLLAQAERCRWLVASMTDPDTVERLTGLADECERRAAEITSKGEEGDR